MSDELRLEIESLLMKGLTEKDLDALKQHGFIVGVNASDKVKVTPLVDDIVIKINLYDSYDVEVSNHPPGVHFDIRNYEVPYLSDDEVLFDEDNNRYKSVY